jgi:pimeloyl-ACP methyl ester carboxylesterase/antitoxin (DNA-binding transcriptional repressor) of toxin-antitoxin stability system
MRLSGAVRSAATLAALFFCSSRASATPALTLPPCQIPGVEGVARCGTFSVWEDRAARTGRRIDLNIVVLEATKTPRAPDALAFLEGGPGEAAAEGAAGLARELARIREHRDILLVDQRGTGKSNSLACEVFGSKGDLESYLREFLPAEAARRCRAKLEPGANLGLYTTSIAADDLDDVRTALGYGSLDLFGVSYGTRASLVYLRRHPDHVRTVMLHGVAPVDQSMPLHFARDTQRALEGVLDECAAEAACRKVFPDGRRELARLIERLSRTPATVEVLHPDTGAPATVHLSRDVAAETLRYLAYSTAGAQWIPAFVHAGAAGDLRPLAEMGLFFRRAIVDSGSIGVYLSVTCAEDLPWVDLGEAGREAEGTALGDYRAREQKAACALWPRGEIPDDYRSMVASDKPVLIFSGALDPVTPPAHGDRVAKTLPHSKHLVVPDGGHSFDGLEGLDCVSNLRAEFVERGSAEGLDTRCIAAMHRSPFPTEIPKLTPAAVEPATLARLPGAFRSQDGRTAARVEAAGAGLTLSVDGEPAAPLVPVSPTRFRIAGSPLAFAVFELSGDRVGRLVIEDWGRAEATLLPEAGTAAPKP